MIGPGQGMATKEPRAFTRGNPGFAAGSTARPWSPERTEAAPAKVTGTAAHQRAADGMLRIDRDTEMSSLTL
jgi:hypothetical protein